MTENRFEARALALTESGALPRQLMYNLATSIDDALQVLSSDSPAPFSKGETYRTARAEIALLRNVFPAKTPEDDLVRDMLESISAVKHKA